VWCEFRFYPLIFLSIEQLLMNSKYFNWNWSLSGALLALTLLVSGCASCYEPGYHMRQGRLRPPPRLTSWHGEEPCFGYHATNWRAWDESCGTESYVEHEYQPTIVDAIPSTRTREALPPSDEKPAATPKADAAEMPEALMPPMPKSSRAMPPQRLRR
jgi:hypothetical protein